jgi:transcriptional regulator with XRE-family HTH domain
MFVKGRLPYYCLNSIEVSKMLRGDRLRGLRLQNNYTIEHLAELLDLSMRQTARYEAEPSNPTGDVIARMADVFNVSADYLLGRTDDPKPCYDSEGLTQKERDVLAALRRGEPLEAIKVIVSDSP